MSFPNFRYEKIVWKRGIRFIAGIDEVGRGAFAGPVVAGCVVFDKRVIKKLEIFINTAQKERETPVALTKTASISNNITIQQFNNILIDDSKRLTSKQRNSADVWIRENCLTWGIGEATAWEIDKLGIVKATKTAMRRAIGKADQRLHNRIQYLLIDAFYIPYVRGIRMPSKSRRKAKYAKDQNTGIGQQTAIIKGDQKSLSIASASIIAKVYRDSLMEDLSKRFKKYHWEDNKGYGTLFHRSSITKYGLTHLHRRTFISNIKDTNTSET